MNEIDLIAGGIAFVGLSVMIAAFLGAGRIVRRDMRQRRAETAPAAKPRGPQAWRGRSQPSAPPRMPMRQPPPSAHE